MLTEREIRIANALKAERDASLDFLNERERRIAKNRIDSCCFAVAKALENWDDTRELYCLMGIDINS